MALDEADKLLGNGYSYYKMYGTSLVNFLLATVSWSLIIDIHTDDLLNVWHVFKVSNGVLTVTYLLQLSSPSYGSSRYGSYGSSGKDSSTSGVPSVSYRAAVTRDLSAAQERLATGYGSDANTRTGYGSGTGESEQPHTPLFSRI